MKGKEFKNDYFFQIKKYKNQFKKSKINTTLNNSNN